jgi:hypothetical protein
MIDNVTKKRTEVEISFNEILPFLRREQIWEEQYWNYFETGNLCDEICQRFNRSQDMFEARYDGDDCDSGTGETIHPLIDETEMIPEVRHNFKSFWHPFLHTLDYDELLRSHYNPVD